jgi:GTPase SAR1 family protein
LDSLIKLLLLGAGESGKSTIAKQMKIIHLQGFTEEERLSYKAVIYSNLIGSMRSLVVACEMLDFAIQDKAAADLVQTTDTTAVSEEVAQAIKTLWREDAVQKAFAKQNQFQLNDSAAYYFENLDRIKDAKYVPSDQDVLRSRAKTTGIIETPFTIENSRFLMVDVGGQRSERKKWMHCFQGVTAVIFVTALSEYDLKLYEDDTTNRMMESLKLFSDICNSKWFLNTAMILFLNKRDVFEEKIQKIDLSICFPDYKGKRERERERERER